MMERRESPRDKMVYSGVAGIGEGGGARDCMVRNLPESRLNLAFKNTFWLHKQPISLTIARTGRSLLARIIWWRDNFVGAAFRSEPSFELPVSDLEERLRKSEQKKQQLQARIKELIGQG